MSKITLDERINNGITIADATVFGLCELESEPVCSDAILFGLIRTATSCLVYRGWEVADMTEQVRLGVDDGHGAIEQNPPDEPPPYLSITHQ